MGGDPRVGTELQGYLIEDLIGRGGMSVVYLAEHLRLKRKVALKLLAPELAENAEFRDRFIRESQLAAGLDHPNVIPVYDAGEADGVLYIAMRYVRGTDLRELLGEGPLDPAEAVRVVEQVASALDAAHGQGLVHRDVKPGNVLIAAGSTTRPLGHLYLADFGLTKRALSVSGLTHTGQLVGTIDYVAPEQIKGELVDGRTDVYSLGCMSFECLTGQTPFAKDSEVASIYAHLMEPPPSATQLRPELPARVDPVLAKALAKAPEGRHATAGELATDLHDAVGPAGGGFTARPTKSVLPTTVPLRRWRTALIAGGIAAVVIVAVVATVVALSRGGGKQPGSPNRPGVAAGLVPNVQGVAQLDPRTGKIVAHSAIALGVSSGFHSGGRLAAGEGAVWIVGGQGGSLQIQQVDPRTTRVIDTLHPSTIGSGYVTPIAIGDGRIWILPQFTANSGTVLRIDPATGRLSATIPLPNVPTGFTIGKRNVWVSYQNGNLSRIGLGSTRVNKTYTVGTAASGVAEAGDVWVSNAIDGIVYRFDPVKQKVVQTISLPGGADAITAGEGAVWVVDRSAGSVYRIDPTTGSISLPIRVGALPTGVATGAGAVWVANGGDGTVSRIDPVTYQVTSYRVTTPPSPFDIAVGEGGVWTSLIGPTPNPHG